MSNLNLWQPSTNGAIETHFSFLSNSLIIMMRNYTKYMHKSFAEAIPNLQSENMTLKLQKFGMCCSHGNQTRLEKSRQTHADISKMAEESFHIFKLSEKLTIVFWSVRIRFLVKQYLFQIFNNLKSSFQLFMFIIFWQ